MTTYFPGGHGIVGAGIMTNCPRFCSVRVGLAAGENVLLWMLNFEQFCLAALLGVVYATVPNHPGKDIPPGTLRNIEKQLESALGKGWATK